MSKSLYDKASKSLPKACGQPAHDILRALAAYIAGEEQVSIQALAQSAAWHEKMMKGRLPRHNPVSVRTVESSDMPEGKPFTVVDIVSDDMPFLIDSVAAELNSRSLTITIMAHPLMTIRRGKKGEVTGFVVEGTDRESHIHFQLRNALSPQAVQELKQALETVLNDVYHATRDWTAMLARVSDLRENLLRAPSRYAAEEIEEYRDFLDYIHNNNFTLLGYREYKFSGSKSSIVKGSSLGLLADDMENSFFSESRDGLPKELQLERADAPIFSISKVGKRSTVHRRVPLDAIAVQLFDKKGKVTGEALVMGLFTSVTHSRSVSDVPYIRRKVQRVTDRAGFPQNSHGRRTLQHILEKYPRDELFLIREDDLFNTALSIMRLQERQRLALYLRPDLYGRYISCLVYVPRDLFDTRLRLKIQSILEQELEGHCTNYYTTLDDSPLARVMFAIDLKGARKSYDTAAIERRLQQVARPWAEQLEDALYEKTVDSDTILRYRETYGRAFPVNYQEKYEARQSIWDIFKIEQILKDGASIALDLYRPYDYSRQTQLRLKIYTVGQPVTLSDIMPILENFGLRIIAELPFEIRPADMEKSIWIHDFLMETEDSGKPVVIADIKPQFEDALLKIWNADMESDGLNRLVVAAHMDGREVTILRAYVRYMQQMGTLYSRPYIEKALTDNPAICRSMVDLFKAWFDPARQKDSAARAQACMTAIETGLAGVASLDQDRILRQMAELIQATLRTNFYQTAANGLPKSYLSLKLDSKQIAALPDPKPFREIFVYSPRMEGIHLRSDRIARGGIRWSDRHEDFRTEVLGLMKAQVVKNSVIVPTGAKGGFVVKNPSRDPAIFKAEGVEAYKTLIRGMLDVTDNLNGYNVVPPANVVRREGDDPYIVAAADKGTATFSDTANALSAEYGFWLGDAFASGGSAGYDHKVMGITARGAWESVKRHFREMGKDTQTEPFDVIGVGDMAGDVFGNGMLRSETIRLVGAFNHMHIFCDPNPDAAATFRERQRLFKAVKGWGDYDQKLLSKGGRIYLRSEKSLELTAEIKKRFDIKKDKVTPQELIQAMLRARIDLLFFGGIGTYIKASHETHADVGDKSNDQLRVNAAELHATVLGEGANLAITQAGRIEFALKGGRINADFIDNSGGVDSSDHEVNIKILTTAIMNNKKHGMTLEKRNKLLESMTDEVASHVLRNNYQNAQALSLMEIQAAENLQIHARFIADLEREVGLDRALEGLPSDREIEERQRAGKGLTRPELGILQAYSKILFCRDLLATDIPDAPEMSDWIYHYFPTALRKNFGKEIESHRLKREIIATLIANSVVNRLGPTFVKSCMNKSGASAADVTRAAILVRESFGLRPLWNEIESLDNKVPAEAQLKAMRDVARLAERAVLWFLNAGQKGGVHQDSAPIAAAVATLTRNLDKILTDTLSVQVTHRIKAITEDGLPGALARQIAVLPVLASALDIIRISTQSGMDLLEAARAYFDLGEVFQLDWFRQQSRLIQTDSRWAAEALDTLTGQLNAQQAALTVRALRDVQTTGKKAKPEDFVHHWTVNHCPEAAKVEALFKEIKRGKLVDMAILTIVDQRLRALVAEPEIKAEKPVKLRKRA